MTKDKFIESEIVKYEKKTNQTLPSHNRGILKDMLKKEYDYCEKEAVREDNQNSHDDQ